MSIQAFNLFTNSIKPATAFTAHTALRTTAWAADQCAKQHTFSITLAASSLYLNLQRAKYFNKEMGQTIGCILKGAQDVAQPNLNFIREATDNLRNDMYHLSEKIAPVPAAAACTSPAIIDFYLGTAIICGMLAIPPVRSFIFRKIAQIATHLDQSF